MAEGVSIFLHAGYKFSVRTRYNQRTYWRCVVRQCPATVTTTDNILVNVFQPHNHDANFVELAAESFISGVRKRCREEATSIPSIYDEELGGLRNTDVVDMIRQVPTFQACKSSLYRSRAKTTPNMPSSQEDPPKITSMDHGAELWLGKDFYSAIILMHMETESSCLQQMPT